MDSEERRALGAPTYPKAIGYDLDYGCCPPCVLATVMVARWVVGMR